MQTARRCIFTVGVVVICTAADQPAWANRNDTFRLRFSTELHCVRAMDSQGRHCLRWFSEADRRVSREAPSLTSRAACEHRFGECRAKSGSGTALSGTISFQPVLSGIEVTLHGKRVTSVEPLVGTISAPAIKIARRGYLALKNAAETQIRDVPEPLHPMFRQHEEVERNGPILSYPVPRHRLPKRVYSIN
jgi:Protein of unknown function (DUF1190)